MKKKILVIGSLNMDQSIRLDRMPLVGETVMGRSITYQAGGKGANQACAAGRLQAQVRMMGCVGADSFGRTLRNQVEGCGVDGSGIRLIEGCATGMAVIYVDGNGDNSIVVIPGANGECSREYLQQMDEWLCWCDYLLMQMEIPHETVLCAAGRAKELGKTVILNPAPVPDSLPEGLLALTDYVTPNETELEKLTGIPASGRENVRLAAEKLQEMGFNGARKHQKTEDERYAYWCDVKGFLMWCEMPSAYDFGDDEIENFTREWMEIVRQNYNHPAIITWTPFNESWGVPEIHTDRMQQHFTQGIYYLTKAFDPMRPVVSNDGWEHTSTDLVTLHDYEEEGKTFLDRYLENKDGILDGTFQHNKERFAFAQGCQYEGQPVLLTEYGGIAFTDGQEGWGYGNKVVSEEDFLRRLENITDAMKEVPYLCGYCYTQVSDVQQEINGLMDMERNFKIEPEIIREINLR